MKRLKQNWAFCMIWLILLSALEYCGLQTSAPLIVLPPLLLLLLAVLTGRAFLCYILYTWMALVVFLAAFTFRNPLYEPEHPYNIGICVFGVALVICTAVWRRRKG